MLIHLEIFQVFSTLMPVEQASCYFRNILAAKIDLHLCNFIILNSFLSVLNFVAEAHVHIAHR